MTSDPRVGDVLGRAVSGTGPPRAVLLGFPSDEGVRRNGGRPGAREGPAAIRHALRRLTPDAADAERSTALLERVVDLGDVPVSGDLERDQELLGRTLAPWLQDGIFVAVMGGGHETTYGHFLGYAAAGRPVELLNWDAHPDVRELKEGLGHSGSPFRQALEHPSGLARRYTVGGLLPHSAAAAHVAYVRRRGRAVFRGDLDATRRRELYVTLESPALVSFDLDAVDQSAAPGVSAPAVGGFGTGEWFELAAAAGACPAVASVDLVELCPPHDADGRSARLAALTLWRVLHGLLQRPG